MYNPKITVVIPVYNGSNYLKEAIESALNQTYQNIEIIVVNDGSCDGGKTQAIMDSYGDRIRSFTKENGGVASAVNFAIKKMKGQYFAWLSHDDLFKPYTLKRYVEKLQKVDKDTILYGNFDLIDENGVIYGFEDFSKRYTKRELENSVYPVITGCVNFCVCLVPKSQFDRVGVFDETLRITQDIEMLYRVFRNQKIVFINEFIGSKRYHAEQDSATKDVYPDEDKFIYESIKQLSIKECSDFKGNIAAFYLMMRKRLAKEKHILSWEYCNSMIEKAKKVESYEEFTKEELMELLAKSNEAYEEVYEKYEQAVAKNIEYLMGR